MAAFNFVNDALHRVITVFHKACNSCIDIGLSKNHSLIYVSGFLNLIDFKLLLS